VICFFHGVSKSAIGGQERRPPLVGRTCAFEAKKVLDSRFPILVTRYEKRGKKIFNLAVFGVQAPSLLIEILIADYADEQIL
jgi:hypothetical protein